MKDNNKYKSTIIGNAYICKNKIVINEIANNAYLN